MESAKATRSLSVIGSPPLACFAATRGGGLLAVIGEAVKKLPSSIRSQHPEVPWKDIAGMRDVLIHDYVSVDIALVWDTVQRDLPILQAAVIALLDMGESKAA